MCKKATKQGLFNKIIFQSKFSLTHQSLGWDLNAGIQLGSCVLLSPLTPQTSKCTLSSLLNMTQVVLGFHEMW